MSKELIEQLRELSASRKPYATGAHGQILGMESYRIVANGFALECIEEAADRIEELERKVASRDAEVVSLTNQRDYEYVRAENAEQERDQLREQVKMLRDTATRAHRKLSAYVGVCTGDKELTNTIIPMLKEALAATEKL